MRGRRYNPEPEIDYAAVERAMKDKLAAAKQLRANVQKELTATQRALSARTREAKQLAQQADGACDELAQLFSEDMEAQDAKAALKLLTRLQTIAQQLPAIAAQRDAAEALADELEDRLETAGELVDTVEECLKDAQKRDPYDGDVEFGLHRIAEYEAMIKKW